MPVVVAKSAGRLTLALLLIFSFARAGEKAPIPVFGRDTVLVWRSENQGLISDFVVRIAEFLPDRFIEWEDDKTQGTIFMSNHALLAGKNFLNASLFQAGSDTKGAGATTLWLSRQTFRDLKDKKQIKLNIDSIESRIKYVGDGEITLDVNGVAATLPVIKVRDDRGSERWFLDQEDNALLAKHMIRKYTQTLVSISNNRTITLRWIKGKKLPDSR